MQLTKPAHIEQARIGCATQNWHRFDITPDTDCDHCYGRGYTGKRVAVTKYRKMDEHESDADTKFTKTYLDRHGTQVEDRYHRTGQVYQDNTYILCDCFTIKSKEAARKSHTKIWYDAAGQRHEEHNA